LANRNQLDRGGLDRRERWDEYESVDGGRRGAQRQDDAGGARRFVVGEVAVGTGRLDVRRHPFPMFRQRRTRDPALDEQAQRDGAVPDP
jgi:hypothetical protein